MIRVESLHIYPVKSCRGIAVTPVHVDRRGFRGDRRWMIVRADGSFVTQRDRSQLCLVHTELAAHSIILSYEGQQLEIPQSLDTGSRTPVKVWRSVVDAIEYVPARALISQAVGDSARLVYMPDDVERAVNEQYARPGDIVSFADGYPVLLASIDSLHELERRAGTALSMSRFRPNLVISGAAPFEEDEWRRFTINGATFRTTKRCDRCVVTTIDPETSEQGKEPLRTLATFRKRDNAVWFAVNAVPESLGEVAVGDVVESQSAT